MPPWLSPTCKQRVPAGGCLLARPSCLCALHPGLGLHSYPPARAPRLWGKIFEKTGELQEAFDATSLTNLLWAITTANVVHQRTVRGGRGTAEDGERGAWYTIGW